MFDGWFGRGVQAPERVPTDTLLPLRFWDDTMVLKSVVVYSMPKHDVALDGDKLRDALERLVAREGWRKLGARLRKNDKGEIEYHIPTPFTPSRPAVTYSSPARAPGPPWSATRSSSTRSYVRPAPSAEEHDPYRDVGTAPTEPHVLAAHHMPLASLAGFGLRNVVDLTVRAKENRIVCIPGAFIDRLHTRAVAELAASGFDDPFLSHGDVLAAWWARLTASQTLSPDSTRTASIQYAASARKTLGLGPDQAYVSNMFTILTTLLPAKDLLASPVWPLAHRIRRTITEQSSSRAQVEAYFALQRASPGKMMPMFGDAGMYASILSNWCKADLYGQDWAPAAVNVEDREKGQYASYIQGSQLPLSFPEGFLTIGKDNGGDYWIYGFRVAGLWGRLEEALGEMDLDAVV